MNRGSDFWKWKVNLVVDVITLLAIHGNLCLALRHPNNKGKSRSVVIRLVKEIGDRLVILGAMTLKQREEAEAGLVLP